MTSSNLPAVRADCALTTASKPATGGTGQRRESNDHIPLALLGVVLTGAAAAGGMWAPALGIGAGSLALAAVGVAKLRRPSPITQRVVAPIAAVADIADITPGRRGVLALPSAATPRFGQPMTPTTAIHDINGQ